MRIIKHAGKALGWLLSVVVVFGLVPVSATEAAKPRVIVMTDIGNEPDDSESMVRFLLYSNEFDVEGLLAVTSTWLRTQVHPELIEERVRAYGQVLPNLKVHASGYPDTQYLLDRIRAGRAAYGMQGVGAGKDTDASKLIISVVDRPDPRPVWFTLWGGSTDLAQALWKVKATRKSADVARFVAKIRVYSISDQDDAEPWIRATFPRLFWIESVHAFGAYGMAAWIGMSAPIPGSDNNVITREWLDAYIRKGPLGSLYPYPMYLIEGDTPTFLYLIPNGLGLPEHPDWGSWGGRYGSPGPALGLWADTQDTVVGNDGKAVTDNKANIWRWRTDYQNDFAARMAWSLSAEYSQANHRPDVVVNGIAGREPVWVSACEGDTLTLSAQGTRDPDGNQVSYHWWQYREASPGVNPQLLAFSDPESAQARITIPVTVKPAPNVDIPTQVSYHVILTVADDGTPPLKSYRRVVVTVPTAGTASATSQGCRSPLAAPSR